MKLCNVTHASPVRNILTSLDIRFQINFCHCTFRSLLLLPVFFTMPTFMAPYGTVTHSSPSFALAHPNLKSWQYDLDNTVYSQILQTMAALSENGSSFTYIMAIQHFRRVHRTHGSIQFAYCQWLLLTRRANKQNLETQGRNFILCMLRGSPMHPFSTWNLLIIFQQLVWCVVYNGEF